MNKLTQEQRKNHNLLTMKEKSILRLFEKGHTKRKEAERLGISVNVLAKKCE